MAEEKQILDSFLKHRKDQKSMIFLYPILQLQNKCLPVSTYLYVNAETMSNDRYLFALYHREAEGYQELREEIQKHDLWDFTLAENEYELQVFNFEKYFDYYDKVIAGDYASISTEAKMILGRVDHPLAVIGMDPERFVHEYAESFKISMDQIPRKVQFIDKPNVENETYALSKELVELFHDYRGETV